MSDTEHVARCRQWLVDQVEQLAGLRNANPRDPNFKAWRQNTVTVLERIWPGDCERVERFRRIAFTASHSRTGAEGVRAGFLRGGNDAYGYLRALVDVIDREGVPDPAPAGDRGDQENGTREDDFPVLDLPSGNVPAPAASKQDDGRNMIDLGEAGVVATGYEDEHVRPDDAPAPPTLQVDVANAPVSASAPRMPDEAPSAPAPPAPKSAVPKAVEATPSAAAPKPAPAAAPAKSAKPARNGKKKTPIRARLKDLLGLDALEAAAGELLAAEPTERVAPAPAPAPPVPAAAPVEAEAPPAKPAPRADQGIVTSQPRPLRRKMQRLESLASLLSPEVAPEPAPENMVAPAPVNEEPAFDEDESARATQDFMLNSPVLGLQGRPVHRTGDGTQFQDPDAIAIATLASDIGRLGVPEGSRGTARALLQDLARQLEKGELDWSQLRHGVTFAMEHPELARRLLPILLPWLERAA